ncbi:MAG: hypothetical protein WBQ94_07260 [Terracidiphilus sp.]
MPFRFYPLTVLLFLSTALFAQSEAPARHQIYGGYSFQSNTFNGVPGARKSLNGWDASAAFSSWHGLRFKLDTYGYRGSNIGIQQDAYFIMAGAQYDKRFKRETIFGEVLGGNGGLNKNWGPNGDLGRKTSFAMLFGGGLDSSISRHFAYRAGADLQTSNFTVLNNVTTIAYRYPGLPNNFARITTGLVWKF